MGTLSQKIRLARKVFMGWTQPTKKNANVYLDSVRSRLMQQIGTEHKKVAEQLRREHPFPSWIHEVERLAPKYKELVDRAEVDRVYKQAATALDAIGIFDDKIRDEVKLTTLRLVEQRSDLLERDDHGREVLEALKASQIVGNETDLAKLTRPQIEQIADRYAIHELDLAMKPTRIDMAIAKSAGFATALKIAGRKKPEGVFMANARRFRAQLYWKRFNAIEKKIRIAVEEQGKR